MTKHITPYNVVIINSIDQTPCLIQTEVNKMVDLSGIESASIITITRQRQTEGFHPFRDLVESHNNENQRSKESPTRHKTNTVEVWALRARDSLPRPPAAHNSPPRRFVTLTGIAFWIMPMKNLLAFLRHGQFLVSLF